MHIYFSFTIKSLLAYAKISREFHKPIGCLSSA